MRQGCVLISTKIVSKTEKQIEHKGFSSENEMCVCNCS